MVWGMGSPPTGALRYELWGRACGTLGDEVIAIRTAQSEFTSEPIAQSEATS